MLDRMPNRMSEDMSDRMPEDLPVRKCINVMVGITRSKVIFFYPMLNPIVDGFPFYMPCFCGIPDGMFSISMARCDSLGFSSWN